MNLPMVPKVRFIGIVAWLALIGGLSAATLSNSRRVGTGFEFSIVGASNAIYTIEASRDLRNWTPVMTNRQAEQVRMISVVATAEEQFYRVRLLRPLFTGALGASESVEFKGTSSRVDSFDSADPLASTDGQYDPAKARDHGDIMASSALTNSLNIPNAKVCGVLHVGTGGGVVFGPNASVGSSEWVNSGQFGIEPGHLVEGSSRVFVDVDLPTGHTYITPGPATIGGTNYAYVLSNGHYRLSELTMTSPRPMLVTGRAKLHVEHTLHLHPTSGKIVILRDASLDLYVAAPDAILWLATVVNESGNAAAFAYYSLPGNLQLSVGGDGFFAGTIYAPAADVTISGGGAGLPEISGAIVGRRITVSGALRVHYDERLGVAGPEW
jgi:hypothetical protein